MQKHENASPVNPDIDPHLYNHVKRISADYHHSFYPAYSPVSHPQLGDVTVNNNMYTTTHSLPHSPPHVYPTYVNYGEEGDREGERESPVHSVMVTDEELHELIARRKRSQSSPLSSSPANPSFSPSSPPSSSSPPRPSSPSKLSASKTMKQEDTGHRPYSQFQHLCLTSDSTLPWYLSLRR